MLLKEQIAEGIGFASRTAHLDAVASSLWASNGAGWITDEDATALGMQIQAKRELLKGHRGYVQPGAKLEVNEPRRQTLFARARIQRPADRQVAMNRRRGLALSGVMPSSLAANFTTGELATLAIVAAEVIKHNSCRSPVAELAARAGVGVSTARNAIRTAVELGLLFKLERPRKGKKNDTNVLTITSRTWQIWIAARSAKRMSVPEGVGFKKLKPTEMKKEKKEAFRVQRGAVGKVGAQPEPARIERRAAL